MTATELESFVIRLLGDASSFVTSMKSAQESAAKAAADAKAHSEKVEGFMGSLTKYAEGAASTLAGLGIKGMMQEAFGAFEGRQTTMIKLTSAVTANGRAVDATLQDYDAWAAGMAKVTTSSKGTNLAMLQQAESMGYTGDQAKKIVKNAIALAGANGDEAASHLHAVAAMESGHVGRLDRQLGLAHMKEGTEKSAMAQDRLNKMFETAKSVTNTSTGQIKQMGSALKGLKADFGEIIDQAILPLIKWQKEAILWLKTMSKEMKTTIIVIGGIVVGLLLVKGALVTIAAIWGAMTGGFTLILGMLVVGGIYLAKWVSQTGGFAKAWEEVQKRALRIWDYIKFYWQMFVDWATPYWNSFIAWASDKWEEVKKAAVEMWEQAKEKGTEFYEYIKPVLAAAWELAKTIFIAIAAAAVICWVYIPKLVQQAWDWIKDRTVEAANYINVQWFRIVGYGKITWETIRDYVRDAIIMAEFILRNFGQTVDLIWTGIKYYAVAALNTILKYLFAILLVMAMPALLLFFLDWKGIWKNIVELSGDALNAIGNATLKMAKDLPSMLKKGLVGAFVAKMTLESDITPEFAGVRSAALTKLEQELRKEFQEKQQKWGGDFEAFKKDRLAMLDGFGFKLDFKLPDVPQAALEKKKEEFFKEGAGVGAAMNKGYKSEKFDAALAGSAEALARIMAYREHLAQSGDANARKNGLLASPLIKSPEGNLHRADNMKQTKVLEAIRDILKDQKLIKVNQVNLA